VNPYADTMVEAAHAAYQAGRPAEAEAALRLIACSTDYVVHSLYFIGHLCYLQSRLDDALFCLSIAVGVAPNHSRAQNDLGAVLRALGRNTEAVAHLEQAIALDPELAHAYGNLGTALLSLNRPQEALIWVQKSLHHAADKAVAHSDLGSVLGRLGRPREAIHQFDIALQFSPGWAQPLYFRSLMRLSLGDMPAAWADHEQRLAMPEVMSGLRPGVRPLWRGEPVGRLLLRAEQGMGDTIQFSRYVPMVAALGIEVILEVAKPLVPLLSGLPGVHAIIATGEDLPAHDAYCWLLSLPFVFQTRLDTIPATCPYLAAPDAALALWEHRLGPKWKRRIGIAWSGSDLHAADSSRSISLAELWPVLRRTEIEFHVVQRGTRPSDKPELERLPGLVDHSDDLADFTDTAALMSSMDLIISVDTAPLHLAGALGRPVWAMLGFSADWRWMRNRTDSPWYPTMRLFRQPVIGRWTELVADVSHALDRWQP
jgi:tetratricopeptide (TPR) repeat protein